MDPEFHHAGIATDDADALAALYRDTFGLGVEHTETFDGIKIVFLDCGGGYFELLEPVDNDTVAGFLEDRGPGVHHLALAVADIDAALERARENDVALIDERPRPGAWGHEVAFLHPRDTGGVLVEFVEASG
jgi:methylmalonyl-CoA/ethylmalonyl-CoA epimerase